MIDINYLIINNIWGVCGLFLLIFALIISVILIFIKDATDNQNKLIGIIFLTGLVLFANDQWTYLFGLVIIGTIITGTEFMLDFIKWMKTTRNETSDEKRIKADFSITEKASKPEQ